jgi:RimJ/RimL family protein N-acetyltransferase
VTEAADIAAFSREFPHFCRMDTLPEVCGPNLRFRLATEADAEFILSLRLDPAKNRHLSPVAADVEAQRQYIRDQAQSDRFGVTGQLYFIIEAQGRPVGTIRLYGVRGTSFSWGSWILTDDAPKSAAVESTCMVYRLGLFQGFCAAHFEVHKANEKVWQYHERFGARRVGETDRAYLYQIDKGEILAALNRYASRGEIEIIW